MSDGPPLRPVKRGVTPRADDDLAPEADRLRERFEREAAERDRAHRRRTLIGAAVVVAVVAVISVVVAVTLVDDEPGGPPMRVATPFDALGSDGVAIPGAAGAAFSPDGSRLAVRLGRGALGVAENGRFRPVVPAETNVVAFAWYGTASLLVQEGPVSTGQLAVVDVDGTDRGGLPLTPDVPPGGGLAVSRDGRRAVLVSYGTVDIAGQPTPVDLFVVDLPGGATRRLTSTPTVVEGDPHFVGDDRVAVTLRDGAEASLAVIDLDDGTITELAEAGHGSRLLGAIGVGDDVEVVWNDGATIRATALDGTSRRLGSVPAGVVPLSVDPAGQRVVVRESSDDGADTQLRLIRL